MNVLVPPIPDDTIAYLTIRMHAPGTISVSGHVADKRFALTLLEHARDAISRQFPETPAGIVMPNRDVDVPAPVMPLREWGDMAPGDRGDG